MGTIILICVLMGLYFLWSRWETSRQLENEERLLFVGNQYRTAIGRYYENSPGTLKQFPRRLQDLVSDARGPTNVQYIAEMYMDPLGGKEWGLVRSPDGGIMGIHSLSDATPVKKSGFEMETQQFAGKAKHAEWIFQYVPSKSAESFRPERDPVISVSRAAVPHSSVPMPVPSLSANTDSAPQIELPAKPPTRMIRPLAGQIDVEAIQMGAGVPGIPLLAQETDRRRRVCIVNATRYASSCVGNPANSASQQAVLDCVVEAQQRYEQCNSIF